MSRKVAQTALVTLSKPMGIVIQSLLVLQHVGLLNLRKQYATLLGRLFLPFVLSLSLQLMDRVPMVRAVLLRTASTVYVAIGFSVPTVVAPGSAAACGTALVMPRTGPTSSSCCAACMLKICSRDDCVTPYSSTPMGQEQAHPLFTHCALTQIYQQ
eukprot:SAG31_NODE_12365_length_947_cov_0.994104_1_plen_155_part_10